MMVPRAAALLGLLSIASGATLGAQQRGPDWKAFDQYVERAARDWRVPGLAISVVSGDSLVFSRGYGVEEIGKPAPATEHTRFAIGSTTKAMTTAALAMLVDEGKLRWDDRVLDHIPELRLYDAYATRELTVRDLLTHRTGLPNTDILWTTPENQYSMPEMIRRLRYVQPTSSFRSTWNYQNVVYGINGLLVERISGTPWETFMRTRIFAPLGMTESEPLVADIIGKRNVATPHGIIGDSVYVTAMRSTDAVASAGSVYSSVADMSKWMRFMLDSGRVGTRRLIAPATFNEIIAPQMRVNSAQYPALQLAQPHFLSYALGWFVQDYQGETVWMHTGSINGMSAIIGLLPARRVGVFVLANLDHAELRHALMYQVFDLYGRGPRRDWSADLRPIFARPAALATNTATPPANSRPSLELERYAGTYADSAFGTIEVSLGGGVLRARFEKADLGELDHAQYDVFRTRATPNATSVALTFDPDGAGTIAAVRLRGATFVRVRR